MYESPFYLWRDTDGARGLCDQVQNPIIDHFNERILHGRVSDGFVVGSTLQETLRQAALASEFREPFWL